eukprot:639322-Prymnesium_polylepis.1
MYSGDWHAMRAGARCHLSLSPAWHSPQHPCCCNTIARRVPQMCVAKIWGAHMGTGGGGHARRAGRWEQAQSDARTRRRHDGVVHVT